MSLKSISDNYKIIRRLGAVKFADIRNLTFPVNISGHLKHISLSVAPMYNQGMGSAVREAAEKQCISGRVESSEFQTHRSLRNKLPYILVGKFIFPRFSICQVVYLG